MACARACGALQTVGWRNQTEGPPQHIWRRHRALPVAVSMGFCILGPIWLPKACFATVTLGRLLGHMHIEKIHQFFEIRVSLNPSWIRCRWSPQDRWAPPEHPQDTTSTPPASCYRLLYVHVCVRMSLNVCAHAHVQPLTHAMHLLRPCTRMPHGLAHALSHALAWSTHSLTPHTHPWHALAPHTHSCHALVHAAHSLTHTYSLVPHVWPPPPTGSKPPDPHTQASPCAETSTQLCTDKQT